MDEIKVYTVRKPNGIYYLKWFDPLTEEEKWRSARTRKKRDADREAGALQKQLAAGAIQSGVRLRWDVFRDKYADEAFPDLSDATQTIRDVVMDRIETHIAPRYVASLNDAAVARFRKALEKDALSASTVSIYLAHLKAILGWAVERRLITQRPIIKLPRIAASDAARGRPLSNAEFDQMLAAVDKIRGSDAADWKRLVRGLWLSGLRIGEAMILSWESDADFGVDLRGEYPAFRIRAHAQKSKRNERCPMAPDFCEWLLNNTPKHNRTGRVFAPVAHLSEKRVVRTIADIGAKAGILVDRQSEKFASAHDLRRSFATRWAMKVKPQILQRMMRHAAIETTLRFYAQLDTDDIAREIWATGSEG